jgi:DNA-binding XRE family transcriptional regulator
MIHTERQYQRSRMILEKSLKKLEQQKEELAAKSLGAEQIKRVLDPTRAFLQNIENDIQWYERAKKGNIPLDENLETIGRILVALRIAKDLTQEELAKKLDITQAQVSQDENDEYHGISVERVKKILAVFGLEGRVRFAPSRHTKAA